MKKISCYVEIISCTSVSLGDIEGMKVTYPQTIKFYTVHVHHMYVCFIIVFQIPCSSSNT